MLHFLESKTDSLSCAHKCSLGLPGVKYKMWYLKTLSYVYNQIVVTGDDQVEVNYYSVLEYKIPPPMDSY